MFLISPTTLQGKLCHPSLNPGSSHRTTVFSGKFPDTTHNHIELLLLLKPVFTPLFKMKLWHTFREAQECTQLSEYPETQYTDVTCAQIKQNIAAHWRPPGPLPDPLGPWLPLPFPKSSTILTSVWLSSPCFYSLTKWNLKSITLATGCTHSALFGRVTVLLIFIAVSCSTMWLSSFIYSLYHRRAFE